MGDDGRSKDQESWKQLYQAALLEFDPNLLRQKIAVAQRAIGERELLIRANGDSSSEMEALAIAHVALGDLKRIQTGGRVA